MTDLQALHDTTHTMVMGVLNITEDSLSDGGLWLDYTADTGDGFDATATVAWLLAADHLTPDATSDDALPRGRVLVLGGDKYTVYTGLLALALNIVVALVVQALLRTPAPALAAKSRA